MIVKTWHCKNDSIEVIFITFKLILVGKKSEIIAFHLNPLLPDRTLICKSHTHQNMVLSYSFKLEHLLADLLNNTFFSIKYTYNTFWQVNPKQCRQDTYFKQITWIFFLFLFKHALWILIRIFQVGNSNRIFTAEVFYEERRNLTGNSSCLEHS